MIKTPIENEIKADLVPIEKRLTILSIPSGAKVRIDGRLVGNTPIDEYLNCDNCYIALNLDGYENVSRKINISQPETSLTISLNKLKSQFLVESNPTRALIYIDEVSFGSTPKTIDIEAGLHKIELKLEGYKPWVDERTIQSPVDTLDATLESVRQRLRLTRNLLQLGSLRLAQIIRSNPLLREHPFMLTAQNMA